MRHSTILDFVTLVHQGHPIALPTETVYGLAISLAHPDKIKLIFEMKGRPQDNPLIVHLSSFEEITPLAHIPKRLAKVAHLWPGPLTVVLRNKSVPEVVRGGLPTVGIRIPNHPLALALLKEVGPMVAPSANLSGKPSPTTPEHVLEDFAIPILDGGPCALGLESTILSLVGKPVLLRPGAITRQTLEAALGERVEISSSKRALAPGMKYRHYAPDAPLFLFKSPADLWAHLATFPRKRRIVRHGITAAELYQFLRSCNADPLDEINLLLTDAMQQDEALMNRLQKASLALY